MGDRRDLQLTFFFRNCRVRVSFYFFALLCIAAFFDRSGFMMWGLLAAVLHECGHLAAMLVIPGHAPREIRLTPFGMRIENSPLLIDGRGNLLVLAAGSGTNFLCAAVTFGRLPAFSAVSLVLGLLNLLPVESLDGGRILLLLCRGIMSRRAAGILVKGLSWVTLSGMTLLGVCLLMDTGYNFSLLGTAAALVLRQAGSEDL